MSGGSFNYLCDWWPERTEDLRRMADELRFLGFHDIARETESLAAVPTDQLRKVWKAVEWWRSCDWSKADAVEVASAYDRMELSTKVRDRDTVRCRCGHEFTLSSLVGRP